MSTIDGKEHLSADDATRLASYLRANPHVHQESASQIAKEFGLPVAFVENVLHSLDRPKNKPFAPAIAGIGRAIHWLRIMFRGLTHEPLVFIAITTAIAIGFFLIFNYWSGQGPSLVQTTDSGRSQVGLQFQDSVVLTVFFAIAAATMLLHQACYFRHGQVRYALLGSVLAWVISASTIVVIGWIRLSNVEGVPVLVALLLMAFVMFVLAGFYAMISTVAAVLGGIYWVRRHEEARERRSRLELIEHLFDLQNRLRNPEIQTEDPEESFWQQWTVRLRPYWPFFSVVAGLVVSSLEVLTILALREALKSEASIRGSLIYFTEVSMVFATVAAMAFCSFLAKRIDKAIVAALLFATAGLVPQLIPAGGWGMERVRDMLTGPDLAVNLGIVLAIATIASLGARIEDRAARDRRLKANDKATILAEIVRTERQLAFQTVEVCILVIDVAKSSQMKARAHPLEVEYSFREYQRFVARIAHLFEGVVHSTAGDGAVVAFYHCQNAFEAARRIQSELPEFNAKYNKLKSPFRVRIGLHAGSVAGEIGDVQYTEVIDIAAHIEANAPVGGIALSQTVAEQLPAARLAKLSEQVSGVTAYVALQPTVDE